MGELHGRYHHVSVCASDLDRARAFYGGRLGLKEIPRPAFEFPGVWYGLDVSTPTGLRQLFVDDPDGNRVEFIGPTRSPRIVRMEETP